MDLEAQHHNQSSDSTSSCMREDDAEDDDPEISGTDSLIPEIHKSRWKWLFAIRASFAKPFHRAQYTSIPYSPQPSFLRDLLLSIKSSLFSSYINLLLVFVPIGFATYLTDTPPAWTFATNAIAIVPLSALLTDATEKIASEAGDTVGALLNISLGNLVELILFIAALRQGHTRIVEASILGSILVNILLILGSALLASSLVDSTLTYTTTGTQLLGCLLFVSVFASLMPTAYEFAFQPAAEDGKMSTLEMSRLTACVVLTIYVGYIAHELRSSSTKTATELKEETPILGPRQSQPTSPLVLPARTIRFAEEDIVDDAEHRPVRAYSSFDSPRLSQDSPGEYFTETRGRPSATFTRFPSFMSGGASRSRGHSRSVSLGSLQSRHSREPSLALGVRIPTTRSVRSFDETRPNMSEDEHTSPVAGRVVSICVLIASSLLMSLNAELLVSTIDDITHHSGTHLSETLIGLIILPIVGNMAEYITVVTVALRGKLDLAIAVSIGSSVQIALCVAPLTAIAAWIMDVDLTLTFNFFELASLVETVLLVNIVVLSGGAGENANALRGGLICGCYAIIAIGAYMAPEN